MNAPQASDVETGDTASDGAALEIRVHGVHGTSPTSMLGVEASQVAGDNLTGLYRGRKPLPYRTLRSGTAVEAYSWGSLTSGVQGLLGWVGRVLWLTLLPFALVNVAYWARFHLDESDPTHGREARISAWCVRWAGLLLTCLFMLTPCLLFVDLIGWQCYGANASGCPRLPDWLDFMARFDAGRRMAIASIVPFALLAVLWGLSRTTRSRYEAMRDTEAVPDLGPAEPLRSRDMWRGDQRCRRLQYLHVGVGVATVVMFSGMQMLVTVPDTAGAVWATTGLAATAWVVAFVRACFVDHPVSPWDEWLPRAVVLFAVLHLLALWFVPITADQTRDEFNGPFRNNNIWFLVVITGLVALNIVLFFSRCAQLWVVRVAIAAVVVVPVGVLIRYPRGVDDDRVLWAGLVIGAGLWLTMVIWHQRFTDAETARHESAAWRGGGVAVLLGAGGWIALLFSSSLVIGFADYVNGSDHRVSQLDTSLGEFAAAVPGDSVTVAGDVEVKGAVLLSPTSSQRLPQLVGGVLAVDSATNTGDTEQSLFDDTLLPAGTRIVLPERSVSFVDSCVRSTGSSKTNWSPCRPSASNFTPQGSILTAREIEVAHSSVRLEAIEPPQRPLAVPQVLIWTPLVQLAWIVVVGVALALAIVVYWRTAGTAIGEHVFATDADTPAASLSEIRRRRVSAALAHRAEPLTDVVGSLTTLLGLALLVGAASGRPPWQLLPWTDLFSTVSLYAAVGASLLMLLLGSYVRRSESARRAVGILWDLTTFWPRAAHPLAPPCYAERVVPELTTRIRWGLEKNAVVVLSGHSQGSLIAVAVAARLADDELARLRLVTYGSQVRALYGRVFPAVFGPQFIGNQPTRGAPSLRDGFPDIPFESDEVTPYFPSGATTLRARIGPDHWLNLFRRTDALGYRVFTDFDSDHDIPVREVPVAAAGDPGPRIGGHGGYQHTPEYRRILARWMTEDPVDPSAELTLAEPLPLE
jgi:hypothetical protein